MKQTIKIMVVLLMLLGLNVSLQARNAQEKKKTVYEVRYFNSLKISGLVRVFFTQSKDYQVEVVEDKNPKLKAKVKKRNHTLVIETEEKSSSFKEGTAPIVYIKAPELVAVDMSGVTRLNVGELKTNHFETELSGVSKMCITSLTCDDLSVDASGASKIELHAVAKGHAHMHFSGATKGDVSLKGESVDVKSSGAGRQNLTVECKHLLAESSGAGKMIISGTADHTKINASGVAKINTSELNKF